MKHMSRRLLITLVAAAVLAACGCGRHKASSEDCKSVLDRIIELELSESGYRDAREGSGTLPGFPRRHCRGERI